MAASVAFGVHLGCTTACVAVCTDGHTTIIANDAGDRVTPAAVAYTDSEKSVGLPAKQGLIRNAKNTILRAKKINGLRSPHEAVLDEVKNSQCKIVIEKGGSPYYQVERNEKTILVSPKEAISMVYKKMLETVQSHSGSSSTNAVLTVPVNFSTDQLASLREAAEAAGFHILRVISEPSAAALAYGLGQNERSSDSTALVYRLGGTSHDVTLLSITNGMYRIIATEHSTTLGGRDFDELLLKHLAADFKRQWKIDPLSNKRSVAKLKSAAENCKHILSTLDSASCSVDSLCEGFDFECKVSRARFESICSSLFQQCTSAIDKVLASVKLTKNSVDTVILVGGSSRIPKIQQLLKDYFVGKEICRRISPDEVLAYGAAVQASVLLGRKEEAGQLITDIDCTSKTICISVGGEEFRMFPVIPQFCPYPLRRAHTFTTSQDNQDSVCMSLYEVDDPQETSSSNSLLLGKIVLKELPALPKGELKFEATFHVKKDGSLHVHLLEMTSNKTADITIEVT